MAKYKMKYMFDFASGVCIWSVNTTAREKYGYPVKVDALPISNELVHILQDLIARYDAALNWADPASGFLWSDEEKKLWYDEHGELSRIADRLFADAVADKGLLH